MGMLRMRLISSSALRHHANLARKLAQGHQRHSLLGGCAAVYGVNLQPGGVEEHHTEQPLLQADQAMQWEQSVSGLRDWAVA